MIFKVGDYVRASNRRGGKVVEVVEANNTVYVEFEDGVYELDASELNIDYENMKTQFDEAGPLFEYNEGVASKYHDEHYAAMGEMQPIEIMQMVMTPAEFKGFLRGNIIKYTMRAGHKSGESVDKDLDKAIRYREWLLQAEAGLTINPRE